MGYFTGKRCLVTGGRGMIGSQVVQRLIGDAALLFIADLRDGIDLTQEPVCRRLTRNIDYVFHCAGVKGSPKMTAERPADFLVPMLQINTNLLEACRLNNVKKVLFCSSTAVDYDPIVGLAKKTAEEQLRAYSIQYGWDNWTIARLNNIYGDGDNFHAEDGMVIPSIMAKIKRGDNPVVLWGDGAEIRDFAYSGDVSHILLGLMETGTNIIYPVGSGHPITIKTLVGILQEIVPFEVVWDTTRKGGAPSRIVDIGLVSSLIQPYPCTSLKEGLKKTWRWYENTTH